MPLFWPAKIGSYYVLKNRKQTATQNVHNFEKEQGFTVLLGTAFTCKKGDFNHDIKRLWQYVPRSKKYKNVIVFILF